jgi:hypothetical protein
MMSVSKNFLFESVFYYILQEKFEDAKWVIRSRKSKKDRKHKGKVQQDKQRCTKHYTENTMAERKGTTGLTTMYKTLHRKHNGRKERYNRTNNDVQNITQKTKDRTTRTPQKTGDDISKIFPS